MDNFIDSDVRDYADKMAIAHNIVDGFCRNVEEVFQ